MNYDTPETYLDAPDVDSPDIESWDTDLYDILEDESYDTESRRRRRPRPVRTATGASTFRGRPTGGPVTQAQLEAALARVRQQITANATAIKTVDGRVRTVVGDMNRLQASAKKDLGKLRADLRTTQTLSALIPLIAPPDSKFGQVAPLLHLVGSDLVSGSGMSSTSSGGGMLGNTNNLIAIGALAYASGIFDPKR
ncbi:hypothetical protein KXR53_33720 [Inquilinus limosus]|uniref:hypothetical protein n=1 Tax=Inquilinus limosus TaxID=171674 RepID=UPI003F1867BA